METEEEVKGRFFDRNQALRETLNFNNLNRQSFTSAFRTFMYYNFEEVIPCNLYDLIAGTSEFLFNSGISDEGIKDTCPIFGDINILVDKNKKDLLFGILLSHPPLKNIDFEVITTLQSSSLEVRTCINSLFKYNYIDLKTKEPREIFFEVTFIFTEFKENMPDNFSYLAFKSSWTDLNKSRDPELGILYTGRYHKNLLRAVCHLHPAHFLDGVLVTPKSSKDRPRLAKNQKRLWRYAFAINKGLREKYTKEDYLIDGKPCYKAVDSKSSVYDRDVESLLTKIFPGADMDYDYKFYSVTGTVKHIKGDHDLSPLAQDIFEEGVWLTEESNI